jgi:16S rRNA (guanine(966)-N(2))-methyltransferase RsmD
MKLLSVEGTDTRPTKDIVKESLFNILAPHITPETIVLDMFAGTGALGIEALSRGAAKAVFIDSQPESCEIVRRNLNKTNLSGKAVIICSDYSKSRNIQKADIIFLDPPYCEEYIEKAIEMISNDSLLNVDGLIVAEHRSSEDIPDLINEFELVKRRKYGISTISIYQRKGK